MSSFTSLNSTASLHIEHNTFSLLVKFSLVKLDTSCTVILPPSVLWVSVQLEYEL